MNGKGYAIQTLIKNKSRSDYISIRKSKLQSKESYQSKRGSLQNDKRIHSPRGHSNPKCGNKRTSKYKKQKLTEQKVKQKSRKL